MKHKFLLFVTIFLSLMLITGCEMTCEYVECSSERIKGSNYCEQHTCSKKECTNLTLVGNYCENHTCGITGCNNAKETDYRYCFIHTCNTDGCRNEKLGGEKYCSKHREKTEIKQSSIPQQTVSYPSKLTDDQKMVLWIEAQDAVKAQLKSPSTAKFPFAINSDGVKIHYNNSLGIVSIWGWVDAQNSYGATVREEWLVDFKISEDGKKYELTNIEFF